MTLTLKGTVAELEKAGGIWLAFEGGMDSLWWKEIQGVTKIYFSNYPLLTELYGHTGNTGTRESWEWTFNQPNGTDCANIHFCPYFIVGKYTGE